MSVTFSIYLTGAMFRVMSMLLFFLNLHGPLTNPHPDYMGDVILDVDIRNLPF